MLIVTTSMSKIGPDTFEDVETATTGRLEVFWLEGQLPAMINRVCTPPQSCLSLSQR